MKLKWIVIAYLVLNIVLALIPDLHSLIGSMTADWNNVLRILMHFFFDPTAYVWKWIIGLLITVVILIKK